MGGQRRGRGGGERSCTKTKKRVERNVPQLQKVNGRGRGGVWAYFPSFWSSATFEGFQTSLLWDHNDFEIITLNYDYVKQME